MLSTRKENSFKLYKMMLQFMGVKKMLKYYEMDT